MFCDTYRHIAWNNAGRNYAVAALDIRRTEFMRNCRSATARVVLAIRYEHVWVGHDCSERHSEAVLSAFIVGH
jgi:hypothetical protein